MLKKKKIYLTRQNYVITTFERGTLSHFSPLIERLNLD